MHICWTSYGKNISIFEAFYWLGTRLKQASGIPKIEFLRIMEYPRLSP